MKRTIVPCSVCLITFGSASTAINAQAQVLVQELPSNIPGITVVAPPPATMDFNAASASELKQYAVPPRPNPGNAPAAFAKWQSAMESVQTRETPVLQLTNRANGPGRNRGHVQSVPQSEGTVSTSFSNWSGTSVVNGAIAKTEAIIGEFTVPTARQPFGQCGATYSSAWPGIDGNGSNDVLQAGTESDSSCTAGVTSNFYSAWIEWYPFNETRVSSPAITPGDLVFVEVWNTSPTDGWAYIVNKSTNVSAEYHLTAPSGITLKGNSVEWIVERPGVGGTTANLTNYVSSAWPYGIAWNYADPTPTYYTMGDDPASGTLEVITMVDNAGNGISSPTRENGDFLWFQNFGSSQ